MVRAASRPSAPRPDRHSRTLHETLHEISIRPPSIPARPCVGFVPPRRSGARNEEEIVARKKFVTIVLTALSAIMLAGFLSASLTAAETVSHYPNDRANHHPRHLNG